MSCWSVCNAWVVDTIHILFTILCTCVSTANTGKLYNIDQTTFAVFMPTHGNLTNSDMLSDIT